MRLARRERQNRGGLSQSGWGSGGGQTPFTALSRIRSEIDRIFEDPFSFIAPSTSFFEGWEPNIDVYEDRDKITVKAELPGMRKEDISVSLDGNTLVISGERKHEEEKKEQETYRSERYFGRFQRSITLSQQVDPGRIQANYKDGVLTVTLPKSEEAKRRQIEVKT